jgi:hypothetical protein
MVVEGRKSKRRRFFFQLRKRAREEEGLTVAGRKKNSECGGSIFFVFLWQSRSTSSRKRELEGEQGLYAPHFDKEKSPLVREGLAEEEDGDDDVVQWQEREEEERPSQSGQSLSSAAGAGCEESEANEEFLSLFIPYEKDVIDCWYLAFYSSTLSCLVCLCEARGVSGCDAADLDILRERQQNKEPAKVIASIRPHVGRAASSSSSSELWSGEDSLIVSPAQEERWRYGR